MRRFLMAPAICALGAGLVLAAPPAEARHASQECRGGMPVLALLEGGGYAVNAYHLDCGKGAARNALVIPDGAAATGDGVTCSLGGEPFEISGDMVVASGIRAARGDTVLCTDGQSVAQSTSRRGKPRPKRYVKLRPSDAAPLPGGTACDVSDETLSGSFMLTGEQVDVTVAAILVDCGDSSALIVPRGATTTVAPIIKRVRLSCPADRLSIPNRPEGRSSNLVVVAHDQITDCKARLGGRNRQTASFDLTLDVAQPVECGDSASRCTFITSTTHRGDFGLDPAGPLAFADAECNALAANAGLPGSYKAWLSDSTASPSTRFTKATVPYVLVDGTQIADDWDDLTTCNADGSGCLDNPINLTESGDDVSGSANPFVRTWTGTQTDGTPHGNRCSDWTATTGLGVFGSAIRTNFQWTGAVPAGSASLPCGNNLAFFCFQQ